MKATHTGNSYYRCDQKIYLISNPSQTIEYSFEKKENGEPVDFNDVYRKIKDGDLMISPYSSWRLNLKKVADATFDELEQYKNEIDIELIGYGGYLEGGLNVSRFEIDNYYKHDDTIINRKKDEDKQISFLDSFKMFARNLLKRLVGNKNKQINGLPLEDHLDGITMHDMNKLNENSLNNQFKLIDHSYNDFNDKESNGQIEMHTSFDTFSNLVLGNLVIGKVYGPNKHLGRSSYASQNLRRKMKIDELSKRILPVLKHASGDDLNQS
jgi:hypothetical protein